MRLSFGDLRLQPGMTFNETEHPRATDGTFTEKTGAAAEVSLPDPYGEMTRILIESNEFWDAEHEEWDTEELARALRSEGLSPLSVRALNAIIRQDQWRKGGVLNSEGLAAEILRPRSEDEVALASHLAGGSGVVFSGKDSSTPEGYFTAFGKGEGDIFYSYLLDDDTKSIVGRVESSGSGARLQTRVYAGGHLYGGYFMGRGSRDGMLACNEDIVRERERSQTVARVDAELDEASDIRIAGYNARKTAGDSTLEHILRNENGIPIVARRKFIQAYESDNGRVELPRLLHENASGINSDLLRDLRRLAADASQ